VKRKYLGIVLLICLVAPIVTCYCWIQHHRRCIRREVKHSIIAGIEKEDLVLLKFTKEDSTNLEWKHSKEFKFNNYFYDIVERENHGDTTYYWCWWDYKETQLSKQLYTLLPYALGTDTNNQKQDQQLSLLLKNLFLETSSSQSSILAYYKPIHLFKASLYNSVKRKPLAPPPNFHFSIS